MAPFRCEMNHLTFLTHTHKYKHLSFSGSQAVFQSLHSWIYPEGKPIPMGGHSFISLVSLTVNLSALHPNIASSLQLEKKMSVLSVFFYLTQADTGYLIHFILKSSSFSRYIDPWTQGRHGIKQRNKQKWEEKQNSFQSHQRNCKNNNTV